MSEPFLAEIRIVGFNFAPSGWAQCDGQILPINQNQSLFSLLGTIYGGDGETTFALPDLRGRTPIHVGQSSGGTDHSLGSKGGVETPALSVSEMPSHDHVWRATDAAGDSPVPTDNLLGAYDNGYRAGTDLVDLVNGTVANEGGGQGHANMQPYLALNFVIALQGVFPPRD